MDRLLIDLTTHNGNPIGNLKQNNMTTYNWVINELQTAPSEDGLTDVVKVIHWSRTAQDGDINVRTYGTMGCQTPSATDFTAYPDLTYDQVCSWLDSGLQVTEIDLGLDKKIDNIVNPPIIVLPNPWDATTTIVQ